MELVKDFNGKGSVWLLKGMYYTNQGVEIIEHDCRDSAFEYAIENF